MCSEVRHIILCIVTLSVLLNVLEARPPLLDKLDGVKENDAVIDNVGAVPLIRGNVVKQEVIPLSVDKLKPKDHMDAVRLEQDGMLNKDFHKEVFLGNHEEIEDDEHEVAESKLEDIFHKYVVWITMC
jgi:hypothetical protein